MSTTDPKQTNESPKVEEQPRKRYEPPAIEQHAMMEVVTLGTQGPKPKNPGTGC
jgi:hypothetical protein